MPADLTLETLAAEVAALAVVVAQDAFGHRTHDSANAIATRLRAALEASERADAPTPQPTPDRAPAGTPEAEDADVAAVLRALGVGDIDNGRAALSRLATRLRAAERERYIQTARADHATGMVFDIKTERNALRAQTAHLALRAQRYIAAGTDVSKRENGGDIIRDLARLALDAEGA